MPVGESVSMRILVVDDEALARDRLVRLLQRLAPDAQCAEAADGEQALALVEQQSPDLVLLDIRMPGVDGLAVAAEIDEMPNPPAIVFCTAYDEYALEALQHQAVAYLLKPVRSADLERALGNAGRVNRVQLAKLGNAAKAGFADGSTRSAADTARSQVSSEGHRGLEIMPVADIRCFIADQKYVTAYGPGGELLIPDTLKDLQEEFGERFLRVHRNALVAIDHLSRLQREPSGNWVVELNGVPLRPQVSRRHLPEVKRRVKAGVTDG